MEKGMQIRKKGPFNSVEKCSLKLSERRVLSKREKVSTQGRKKTLFNGEKRLL
jgi:hypothetical protein